MFPLYRIRDTNSKFYNIPKAKLSLPKLPNNLNFQPSGKILFNLVTLKANVQESIAVCRFSVNVGSDTDATLVSGVDIYKTI